MLKMSPQYIAAIVNSAMSMPPKPAERPKFHPE
jgi:hypothetical protein